MGSLGAGSAAGREAAPLSAMAPRPPGSYTNKDRAPSVWAITKRRADYLPKRWNAAPRWAITPRPQPRATIWIGCFRPSLSHRRILGAIQGQRAPQDEGIRARFPVGSNSSERQATGMGGWFFWPEAKPQFTPERLSFLNQPLNQPSAQRTVTLTNPGAQELAIDEMRIDGAAAGDFTIVSDDCRGRRLARGEKCSVSLVFTPRGAGGREASLKLIGRPADLLPELTLSGVATSTPTSPSPGVSPTVTDSPFLHLHRRMSNQIRSISARSSWAGTPFKPSRSPTPAPRR